jgi:hypothetical protein
VTNSAGDIRATTRHGTAPPSNASPAEPSELTNPGSLGYHASTGTGVVPVARTDEPFDGEGGIYEYTKGNRYSGVEMGMGVKVNNNLILVAGADGSGDLDISSGGETRIYAKNGPIYLFSGSTLHIDATSDIHITTKGSSKTTVAGVSEVKISGDDNATVYSNSRKHVWGLQTDFFMGMKNQFNLSSSNTFNLGTFFSITAGLSWSIFLTARITWINIVEIKIVNGPDIKVEMSSTETKSFQQVLTGSANKAYGVMGAAKMLDAVVSSLAAANNGLSTAKNAIAAAMTPVRTEMETFSIKSTTADVTL